MTTFNLQMLLPLRKRQLFSAIRLRALSPMSIAMSPTMSWTWSNQMVASFVSHLYLGLVGEKNKLLKTFSGAFNVYLLNILEFPSVTNSIWEVFVFKDNYVPLMGKTYNY